MAPWLPTSSWVVATKYTSASQTMRRSFSAAMSISATQARSSMVLADTWPLSRALAVASKVTRSPTCTSSRTRSAGRPTSTYSSFI